MTNKTLIEKLGFDKDDKVVILHIDDMGFSHASNVASFECLDYGIASCGSAIVQSPWFYELVSIVKKNPVYDIGVHLALTCEYDNYRWRPISSVDPSTGLLDSEGCLWRTAAEAMQNITVEAAEIEMRAQIQKALDSGIDVTHIDTHMGTVLLPKFIPIYIKLSQEFNIPPFLPRASPEMLRENGYPDEMINPTMKMFEKFENMGLPLLDHIIIDTGGEYPDKIKYYCDLLSNVKSGLTHLLFHSAKMGSELKAITPDSAEWRSQDHKAFTDNRLKEFVKKLDLKVIGYKFIRDKLKNG